jgi:hypothetical protein
MTNDGQPVPYQSMLRALGAYLDEQGASGVCLLETTEGFEVLYRNAGGTHLVQLGSSELLQLRDRLEQGRSHRRHDRDGSYQDLLRAVGHELEQVPAYDILIKEIDGRLITTYQFLNPATGYLWHKRLAIMEPNDLRLVVQQAHARRHTDRRHGLLGVRNRS